MAIVGLEVGVEGEGCLVGLGGVEGASEKVADLKGWGRLSLSLASTSLTNPIA